MNKDKKVMLLYGGISAEREISIIIKLIFCKTGPSLLHEDPYQTAIPDKVNAVMEINQ